MLSNMRQCSFLFEPRGCQHCPCATRHDNGVFPVTFATVGTKSISKMTWGRGRLLLM
jgi:hypothetical protein